MNEPFSVYNMLLLGGTPLVASTTKTHRYTLVSGHVARLLNIIGRKALSAIFLLTKAWGRLYSEVGILITPRDFAVRAMCLGILGMDEVCGVHLGKGKGHPKNLPR